MSTVITITQKHKKIFGYLLIGAVLFGGYIGYKDYTRLQYTTCIKSGRLIQNYNLSNGKCFKSIIRGSISGVCILCTIPFIIPCAIPISLLMLLNYYE